MGRRSHVPQHQLLLKMQSLSPTTWVSETSVTFLNHPIRTRTHQIIYRWYCISTRWSMATYIRPSSSLGFWDDKAIELDGEVYAHRENFLRERHYNAVLRLLYKYMYYNNNRLLETQIKMVYFSTRKEELWVKIHLVEQQVHHHVPRLLSYTTCINQYMLIIINSMYKNINNVPCL